MDACFAFYCWILRKYQFTTNYVVFEILPFINKNEYDTHLYYDLCKEMCIIIHLMYLYKGFVSSAQEMFLLVIASGPLSSVVSNPKLFSFNLFHNH